MMSTNKWLLHDLLAYHLQAEVVATQKQITSLKDMRRSVDLSIREERIKIVTLGNHTYMSDPYKDTCRSHSALMAKKCQIIEYLEWLNVDSELSSNTLCNIEQLQHEARAARGLV